MRNRAVMPREIILIFSSILILLEASRETVARTPHDAAHLRRLEHDLTRLQDAAATSRNLHASPVTAQVLRQEARVKQLQAKVWRSERKKDAQNMTLSDLREVLRHKLHSDPSLTVQSRKDINERLVKVMNLLAKRRMHLRAQSDSFRTRIEEAERNSHKSKSIHELKQKQLEVEKQLSDL